MSKFMQYAVVAANEALKDSGWCPQKDFEQERTVSMPFDSLLKPSWLTLEIGGMFGFWHR